MKTETKIKNLPAITGQAIQTAFLPATENKGERIKASCERGQITVGYPQELSQSEATPTLAADYVQSLPAKIVSNTGQSVPLLATLGCAEWSAVHAQPTSAATFSYLHP